MVAVALVVAVLALRNIAGESLVPSALYVPVNLGVTAVLATVACRTRMSADEIGLGRAQAARGLATGSSLAGIPSPWR